MPCPTPALRWVHNSRSIGSSRAGPLAVVMTGRLKTIATWRTGATLAL
jgi:hypothetical protein